MRVQCLLIIFLAIIIHSTVYAQPFSPGTYTANSNGLRINMDIGRDSTVALSYLVGKYALRQDTLYVPLMSKKGSSFMVAVDEQKNRGASGRDSIKLTFKNNLLDIYAKKLALALSNEKTDDPQMKYLGDLGGPGRSGQTYTEKSVSLPRGRYLYLADAFYQNTYLHVFELDNKGDHLVIEYNPSLAIDVTVKIYHHPDGESLVMDDNLTKTNFYRIGKEPAKESSLEPIAVNKTTAANLKLPDQGKDAISLDPFASDTSFTAYNYKTTVESTPEKALKATLDSSRKFLVVQYDPENSYATEDFQDFIQQYELSIQSYMYSGYEPRYDLFNFYLASVQDMKKLVKAKSYPVPAVYFLNGKGELLYFDTAKLSDFKELQYGDSYLYNELKGIDVINSIARIIQNPKASLKLIQDTLRALNTAQNHFLSYAPPYTSEYPQDTLYDDLDYNADSTSDATDIYSTVQLKKKQNIQRVKVDTAMLYGHWRRLLASHAKDTVPDLELAAIIFYELKDQGFSRILTDSSKKLMSETDFLALDYIMKHMEKLQHPDATVSYPVFYGTELSYTIAKLLQDNTDTRNQPSGAHLARMKPYVEKFIDGPVKDQPLFITYVNELIKVGNVKGVLETFGKYHNAIAQPGRSIIEALDKQYTASSSLAPWADYKFRFAALASTSAGFLARMSTDQTVLNTAGTWSKTSIDMYPSDYIFLETHAVVLYRGGRKTEAIRYLEMAMGKYTSDKSGVYYKEMERSLEKMKSNSL